MSKRNPCEKCRHRRKAGGYWPPSGFRPIVFYCRLEDEIATNYADSRRSEYTKQVPCVDRNSDGDCQDFERKSRILAFLTGDTE